MARAVDDARHVRNLIAELSHGERPSAEVEISLALGELVPSTFPQANGR